MAGKLIGMDRMVRRLRGMPHKVQGAALLDAAMAAAAPIKADAQSRAPRGATNRLADSIVIEATARGIRSVTVAVGPHRDAFYGRFQEFGTAHHPAQPFLRPAFDASRGRAMIDLGREFWARIRRGA